MIYDVVAIFDYLDITWDKIKEDIIFYYMFDWW